MWSTSTSWASIRKEARWTVELYASLGGPRLQSRYTAARISELVTERRETLTPSRWPEFGFCYIGLENVATQTGMLETFTQKAGRDIQSACGVFRAGDVLYGRLRPYLNKAYYADEPVHTGICSGEFFVLTPKADRIRGLFLRELLASSHVADKVRGMQFGSSLPRLQLRDLLNLEVPLPPIDAQVAIEADLHSQRQSLSQHIHAARSGGTLIRRRFERFLADKDSLRPTESSDVDMAEACDPFPNELPGDYVASPRGRRLSSLDLFS